MGHNNNPLALLDSRCYLRVPEVFHSVQPHVQAGKLTENSTPPRVSPQPTLQSTSPGTRPEVCLKRLDSAGRWI
jgi:hypothetical protein